MIYCLIFLFIFRSESFINKNSSIKIKINAVTDNKSPIVRFAPSPTGRLHIAGARTHLYNQLFAHLQGGKVILRIDDTDPTRCRKFYENDILESLQWLGLLYDEGPIRQSERLDLYKDAANWLISQNVAYRCYCTKEELYNKKLQAKKQGIPYFYDRKCLKSDLKNPSTETYSIRLKTEEKDLFFINHKGNKFTSKFIGDYIIIRSNGVPTYNFACAVDDKFMNISHVIRSNDHHVNTFKQYEIINKLNGFRENYHINICYVHCPMILTPELYKISKRDQEEKYSIWYLKSLGYLPKAILNYIATLGWFDNTIGEIFNINELKNFDLSNLAVSSTCFSFNKLNWYNRTHIKSMEKAELAEKCTIFLKQHFKKFSNSDLSALVDFSLDNFRFSYFQELYQNILQSLSYKAPILENINPKLVVKIANMNIDDVINNFQEWIEKLKIEIDEDKNNIFENVRYLLTGNKTGMPLHNLLKWLHMADAWPLDTFTPISSRLDFLKANS